MQVAMYYKNDDVRIEEMPVPEIESGEILVKIEASGLCGSDVMEWYRIKKAPLVLGHEIAGTVDKIGDGVNKFKLGDRVTVAHHVPCNTCRFCLNDEHSVCDMLRTTKFYPGGFCEYVRVPAINVDRGTFIVPDNMSFEEGSFSEPLGCVVRAQRKAGLKAGMTVLVVGSGLSGMLHIKLAKALGASRILASDISELRIKEAVEIAGADHAFHAKDLNPDYIRKQNSGRLIDLVIVCVGAQKTIENSIACVERSGTALLFAPTSPDEHIKINLWDAWKDNIKILTSYASPPADTQTAIDLIASGRIKVTDLITHRLPLSKSQEGFKLVAEAKDCMKVIIEPQK